MKYSQNAPLIPAFDKTASPDRNGALRREYINLLLSRNYELLARQLKRHSKQEISSFFRTEGRIFLSQSLIASTSELLNFIADPEHVPPDAVNHAFNLNKTELLTSFIYARKMSELRNGYDPEEQALMVKKFRLLLKIESTGVKSFMDEYALKTDTAVPSIIAAYQTALSDFKQSTKPQVSSLSP